MLVPVWAEDAREKVLRAFSSGDGPADFPPRSFGLVWFGLVWFGLV